MSGTAVSDQELEGARGALQGFSVATVAYGTVRDYCESADLFPTLASLNKDLKDQQRCWMLKCLMMLVPPRSRLLEIGAGDPIVADAMTRLGHSVVVVDPYDGGANGPTALEQFRLDYPRVEFIADLFTPALQGVPPGSIDCCYSISVLEHVPLASLSEVIDAMSIFTKPGGQFFHAVDCVTSGAGAEFHTDLVTTLAGRLTPGAAVKDTLASADVDPETYYLSAEAHNLWRGRTPYHEFPMRRCISVQIATTLSKAW